MIHVRTTSVDETRSVAARVAGVARACDILLLAGDLGAGKTAFAQGFGKGLGVDEAITSPTFTIVRAYQGRLPFTHIDVYRLDYLQEVTDLGIAELLDDGGVTLIEWGDVVAPVLPADFLEVSLEMGPTDDERSLRMRPVGTGWSARTGALRRAVEPWAAASC